MASDKIKVAISILGPGFVEVIWNAAIEAAAATAREAGAPWAAEQIVELRHDEEAA